MSRRGRCSMSRASPPAIGVCRYCGASISSCSEHESVVLLGANGAGKTTLLKAIMGLVEVWAGRIDFAGENIGRLRTDQRVQRGIVFMSETSGFPGLTVEENVLIGAQFLPAKRARGRIDELYAIFPALAERRRLPAGSLSGGQRKMLGIAKALVGNPRLLVMDEPSAGLSPLYVKEVIAVLAQFRAKATGAVDRGAEREIPGARRPRLYPRQWSRRFLRHRRRHAGERCAAPRLFRTEIGVRQPSTTDNLGGERRPPLARADRRKTDHSAATAASGFSIEEMRLFTAFCTFSKARTSI